MTANPHIVKATAVCRESIGWPTNQGSKQKEADCGIAEWPHLRIYVLYENTNYGVIEATTTIQESMNIGPVVSTCKPTSDILKNRMKLYRGDYLGLYPQTVDIKIYNCDLEMISTCTCIGDIISRPPVEQITENIKMYNDISPNNINNLDVTYLNGAVRIKWDPPNNTNQAPIFGYWVHINGGYRHPTNRTGWVTDTERDITVYNLDPIIPYEVQIRPYSIWYTYGPLTGNYDDNRCKIPMCSFGLM